MKSRDFQTCHGPGQFGRCIQSWRSNLNPYWRIKETKTKNWEISQRHLRKQSPDKNTECFFFQIGIDNYGFCYRKRQWNFQSGRRSQMALDFVSVNDAGRYSRNIFKLKIFQPNIIWVKWTSAFKLWKTSKFNLTAKRAFCSVFFDGSVLAILRSKGHVGLF